MADDKKKNIDMFGVRRNDASAVPPAPEEEYQDSNASNMFGVKQLAKRAVRKGTEAVAAKALADSEEAQAEELASESVNAAEVAESIENESEKDKKEEE